jgi:acyl-CoA dehydrogenase
MPLCLIRETLAWHHGLADFAFAMQGLGSGAISLAGTPAQKDAYLRRVASGHAIAAFALSEHQAGSDVAAMQCSVRCEGDHFVLNGEKTWISNGGIADFYVVFARHKTQSSAPSRGTKDIAAFIVDANALGVSVAERFEVIAPHPLARIRFDHVKLPKKQLLGEAGQGFKIAMATLDVFRTSVAAAALGFGQRAFDESLKHAKKRILMDRPLADYQLTQVKLADMAMILDAARLQTYRAAWLPDQSFCVTQEAAMAKFSATEGAQRVIDMAVQLHGGLGVKKGSVVESLYREIRALRIYEGASEVQQLIQSAVKLSQPWWS